MTNSRSNRLVLVGSNLVTKLVGSVGVLLSGVIIKWAGFDDASSLELKEVAVYNLAEIKGSSFSSFSSPGPALSDKIYLVCGTAFKKLA